MRRVPGLLPLALFLYVCLDIANPLMPGVVQLVEGSLQVMDASTARSGEDHLLPDVALPAGALAVVARMPLAPGRRPRRRPPARRRTGALRRPPRRASEPPPPSVDH